MPSLLLHPFVFVCILTACESAVSMETVVGFAGRKVILPCHTEAASQSGVEVCWGRGEPSVFSCHNAVIHSAGEHITYKKSYRYSISSISSSLSIFNSRPADSGFYHCRVQLPGLFNDQTSTVHLIITNPRRLDSDSTVTETKQLTYSRQAENLNPLQTVAPNSFTRESDVTRDNSTGPIVAQVQSSVQQHQVVGLQTFVGNTVRASFIIFIPALLLTTAYTGVWKTKHGAMTDKKLNQSEEEQDSSV